MEQDFASSIQHKPANNYLTSVNRQPIKEQQFKHIFYQTLQLLLKKIRTMPLSIYGFRLPFRSWKKKNEEWISSIDVWLSKLNSLGVRQCEVKSEYAAIDLSIFKIQLTWSP